MGTLWPTKIDSQSKKDIIVPIYHQCARIGLGKPPNSVENYCVFHVYIFSYSGLEPVIQYVNNKGFKFGLVQRTIKL